MAREKYSCGYAQDLYKPFRAKEERFDLCLKKGKYYVVRFDGKGMTSAFKIKHKAINDKFFNTMEDTFNNFCKSAHPNVLFGFSFSDEISILIRKSGEHGSEYNRIEKLLSLLSGKLSLLFYHSAQKHKLDLKNQDWLFDARIIELAKQEVPEYFLSRQAYAIDKYIMQLKGEYSINYKLNTSEAVLSELQNVGACYDHLPVEHRYGLIYSKFKKLDSFEFDANKELLSDLTIKY